MSENAKQEEKVQSALVWATLYELKTYRSLKEGTWNTKGDKRKLGSKLVSREYVEKINAGLNADPKKPNTHVRNKMYVTDEAKTKELMEKRNVSIAEQAIQKQKDGLGQHHVVDALINLANRVDGNDTAPQKSFEEMDDKELRIYCIQNDIEVHHKAGREKLLEAINKNK